MLRWFIYLPFAFLTTVTGWILTPILALFIVKEMRTDRVKILGNEQVTMLREYLHPWLRNWQTFDNAVDEYFYGQFYKNAPFRFLRDMYRVDYDRSPFLRYCCRCAWLWRNCAYGYMQGLFGRPLDETLYVINRGDLGGFHYTFTKRKSSWQLIGTIPIGFGYQWSVNCGWKPHDGFDRVMFASRFPPFGLKKEK